MANRPPPRALNLFHSAKGAKASHLGGRKALGAVLHRLGPTWQATPLRRIFQTLCLLLYLDLFFRVSWPYAARFSSLVLPAKEWLPVELFLWIDPLAGLSAAIAARWWIAALIGMGIILAISFIFPRGFCGYLCPLGTLIDLFDYGIGKRIPWFRTRRSGPWVNARFYLLIMVLAAALGGVLLSGYVAAIPVLTRGLVFSAGNLQLGLAKNWGMVPPLSPAVWGSLVLFGAVFLLSLFGPRFWCRCICPSGALLSLPGWLHCSPRQVADHCLACGKCIEVCSFDAIQPDYGTRVLNCTFCQTCGGICPTEAISFVPLSAQGSSHRSDVATGQAVTRRTMLGSVALGAASSLIPRLAPAAPGHPIRPPGSLPEERFLDLCIRCEQCLKVCPGPVLQAAGLEYGWEALWTPVAVFPHAGCHQDCNFCTLVCPTGAIRPLALAEKRRFAIGLAVVNTAACLPHRGERDCQLCFDECNAAGYRAIEMRSIKLATGPVPEGAFSPDELEQMGRILAPFVKVDACVGCGLCEYRCQSTWVSQQKLLQRSAVLVKA